MTDTQTMRETFEKTTRLPLKRNMIYKDQYDDLSTEDAWFCFQAAWTRKPAAQVAGAARSDKQIVKQTEALADALAKLDGFHSTVPYMTSASPKAIRYWKMACIAQEMLTATDPVDAAINVEEDTTHPAPEPDATKVVSVPVPWEQRVTEADIRASTYWVDNAKDAELAEWRALAADRGRT